MTFTFDFLILTLQTSSLDLESIEKPAPNVIIQRLSVAEFHSWSVALRVSDIFTISTVFGDRAVVIRSSVTSDIMLESLMSHDLDLLLVDLKLYRNVYDVPWGIVAPKLKFPRLS